MTKTVIAGALGECVHVAGVSNFLRLAQEAGWETILLGPAASIEAFLEAAQRARADMQPDDELLVIHDAIHKLMWGVPYRNLPRTKPSR